MRSYGVIDLFGHAYEIVEVLEYYTQEHAALVRLSSLEAFHLPHTYTVGVSMDQVKVYAVDGYDEPPC